MQCASFAQILQQYQQRKNDTLKLLQRKPNILVQRLWKDTDLLQYDRQCCTQLGLNKSHDINNKLQEEYSVAKQHYCCENCKGLELVVDLYQENIGKPFEIKCKPLAGQKLVIIHNMYPRPIINNYVGNALATDYFTNHILVTWLVEQILNVSGINSMTLYTGFICGRQTYLLKQWYDYDWIIDDQQAPQEWFESEHKLRMDLIKYLFGQLINNLILLKSFNFVCFNLKPDLFKFDTELTLVLNNIKKAGIDIPESPNRVYYQDYNHEQEISTINEPYIIVSDNYIKINKLGTNFMRRSIDFFYQSQRGLVEQSDIVMIYMYLLYFLGQQHVQAPELFGLLFDCDSEVKYSELKQIRTDPEFNKYHLLNFLRGKQLRKDILDHIGANFSQ